MNATKAGLRAAFLSARRAVGRSEHDAEARMLAEHVGALAAGGQTVCAYVPVDSEPGSLELVDSLYQQGARVLLPVARLNAVDAPLPLRWGVYVPGELTDAPFGLREPAMPWSAPETIADAAALLIPALAVDRAGVRLGRGAGFYDRSLPLVSPTALLVAVVRDDELVDRLPAEPHDVPMTHALTPRLGLVALSGSGGRE
ncbi:5-formyltetrahydrofolate cyclo-ligase [Mycobacterium sp. E740]|uniref:5-formyltetrahydrofolate cyclo-ligase n=1 Tax=Mycobacterium sp. E740 TaxID=1834149 RepID=UPI0008020621|nr:5-formyltetrahydrofolate cyclo-ligase [Mycobacterium sp. E740]OBI82345.1 5-formyltetrahydrofolate cyclo-ligase [Mycobacterium sp. E740]